MATFGYGRVSTSQQSTDNQRLELETAGYRIDFWHEDVGVSGSTPAMQRPGFAAMVEKIRHGETLVVGKLDRLGRDAGDVLTTLRNLKERGISVKVHNLAGADLTAPAGKLIVGVLAVVAEMERDLLIERTQAGLKRAKAQGVKLGRPAKTSSEQRGQVRALLASGETVSEVARRFGVSRATIIGIRDSAETTARRART